VRLERVIKASALKWMAFMGPACAAKWSSQLHHAADDRGFELHTSGCKVV
jgi:hypothetical protein